MILPGHLSKEIESLILSADREQRGASGDFKPFEAAYLRMLSAQNDLLMAIVLSLNPAPPEPLKDIIETHLFDPSWLGSVCKAPVLRNGLPAQCGYNRSHPIHDAALTKEEDFVDV